MYLFKTSGKTFASVVRNGKHAFKNSPKEWTPGELVLVSKNKQDCVRGERQIQYVMTLSDIRPLRPGEAEKYWPGSEGRWRYLAECTNVKLVEPAFDLEEVLGLGAREYRQVMTFSRLQPAHATLVADWLRRLGLIP